MAATTQSLLRLTNVNKDQAGFFLFNTRTPIQSSKGISATFNFYSYGGTGGDGLSFALIDGSKSPTQAGGFGGSLGYAPRTLGSSTRPGIVGGYLGIGFDEFGNFSRPTEGRIGGLPLVQPDSIAVRGSEATSYKYLGGKQLTTSLDNPTPTATREASKQTAKVDLTASGQLVVSLDFNKDGDFTDPGEKLLDFNVIDVGNTDLPDTLKFVFTGSTGTQTNIHEVDNFVATQTDGTAIDGSFSSIIVRDDDDTSTPGEGVLTGTEQDNLIFSTNARDIMTGGLGADRFIFQGTTKRLALKTSTLARGNRDRITDFNFAEGDRIQLDFDADLSTIELPKKLFNAGRFQLGLQKAVRAAYADRNFKRRGEQALQADEAVIFRARNRTYLSVNNGRAGFAPQADLLVDVTGIQFKSGDLTKATLGVGNYFATTPLV
jgi:serralysin